MDLNILLPPWNYCCHLVTTQSHWWSEASLIRYLAPFCSITLSSCLLMQTFRAPVHDRMISWQPLSMLHMMHTCTFYTIFHSTAWSFSCPKPSVSRYLKPQAKQVILSWDELWWEVTSTALRPTHACFLAFFDEWSILACYTWEHKGYQCRKELGENSPHGLDEMLQAITSLISAWSRAYRDIASWSILYIAGILHGALMGFHS